MAIDRHRHIDERDRSIDHRKASGDRASIADSSMSIIDGSMIFDSRSPICNLRCPTEIIANWRIGDWQSTGIDTSTTAIVHRPSQGHRAIVHRSPIPRCRLSMDR
jgi:hypothetical protein